MKDAIRDTTAAELADSTRWTLCGPLSLAFASLAAMTAVSTRSHRRVDLWLRLTVAAVALTVALAGGGLGPLPVGILLAAATIASVALELATHQHHEARAETPTAVEPV